MKSTQYLYELNIWRLESLEYFEALEYKLECAKILFEKLYLANEDKERQFWVNKAIVHTEMLIKEGDEWSPYKEIVCENRNCTKVMFAIRFKYYCSDKCKIDQQKFELRQRKKDEKILVPKQKIKPVFLVRGNISGVHYK